MIDIYLVIGRIKLRDAMEAIVGQKLLFIQVAQQTQFLFLVQHSRSDQCKDDVSVPQIYRPRVRLKAQPLALRIPERLLQQFLQWPWTGDDILTLLASQLRELGSSYITRVPSSVHIGQDMVIFVLMSQLEMADIFSVINQQGGFAQIVSVGSLMKDP